MIKISMPNKFQLRIMPELRGWFLPKKGGEIHYIGGAEILPAPFSREEESKILDLLGTEEDQNARSRLIEHNLRLVVYIAKKFDNTGIGVEDLISIGTIGLIKAINNFNPELEVKFSTYAVPMIIGEIRRFIRDNNSIRVSRSLRDTAYKAIYAKENYVKVNQKEPTVQEIAEEIGIAKEEIVYALDAIQMPVSLNEPVYNDNGDAMYVMDQISDKRNKEDRWVEKLSLQAAMDRLGKREKYIIRLRFFEGKTQMEVAEEIGISQAQVSRLEKNALRDMRQYLRSE